FLFIATGVFLYALLIDALAPTFNGTSNRVQAVKVAAYSATPGLVAGIFLLIPDLAILMAIGVLYCFYLIFLGLPKLMKVPADRTVPYIVSVIVAGILIVLIASMI